MKKNKILNVIGSTRHIPWRGEELLTYSIKLWADAPNPIRMGEFKYQLMWSKDSELLKIVYRSELEYVFEGLTTETVEVLIYKDTLRPHTLNCELNNMSKHIKLDARYEKRRVDMIYWEDGLKDRWAGRIPYRALDNYQVPMTLRCLDFENMTKENFSIVNTLTCSIAETECMFSGTEKIYSPVGFFDCYRVCCQVYDPYPFTQYFLFSIEEPHHLIKVIRGAVVYELSYFDIK